jgi:hypothetical protein
MIIISEKGTSFKLPDFIDRGKAWNTLCNFGLGKEIADKKHQHNDLYTLTSEGKEFFRTLKTKFDLRSIFNAPLHDKDEFDLFISNFFEEEGEDLKTESLDEILSLFINIPLNEPVFRSGIPLIFLGYEKISKRQDNIRYSFKFKTTCPRCESDFNFQQDISYNAERYKTKPAEFQEPCPNCGLYFKSNAYINEWWFEEY